MCVNILCFFGVLYLLSIADKHLYKLLPEIDLGYFFNCKLGIEKVTSFREYVLALVKIYRGLKKIGGVKEEDISEFDIAALNELKQFVRDELSLYIRNSMLDNTSMLSQIIYSEYQLKRGKLVLYSSKNKFTNYVSMKFESFSDMKLLLYHHL